MKMKVLYDEACAQFWAVGTTNEDSFVVLAKFIEREKAHTFIADLKDIQDGHRGSLNVQLSEAARSFDFEAVYKAYPRKQGKSRGLTWLKTHIKTEKNYGLLLGAVKNYAAYCGAEIKDEQYIKHFSTWVKEWRDWSDENYKNHTPEARRLFDLNKFSHV